MTGAIVCLEGADSSGKTTLAEAIGGARFHGTPFVGWVEEAHAAMMNAALKHVYANRVVILDRHWVSEFVYGPIFRGKVGYSDGLASEFDRTIRHYGVYVLCVPSDAKKHEERFAREKSAKGEDFPHVGRVAEKYRRLLTGYMHEEGDDYLSRYVRHGDFAMTRCMVYDMDRERPAAFAAKVREALT